MENECDTILREEYPFHHKPKDIKTAQKFIAENIVVSCIQVNIDISY